MNADCMCKAVFQLLIHFPTAEWSGGARVDIWLENTLMAGSKLHHALKTLLDTLYFPAYMKGWLEMNFELLILKGEQFTEAILGLHWCLWVFSPQVSFLIGS